MENKFVQNEYNVMLFNVLQNLGDFPHQSGGEGVAYFLGDKFVVKEYSNVVDYEKFDAVFEPYCLEMQRFAEAGYNVPKIYSWLKVPNPQFGKPGSRQNNRYKYFILEEMVPGRNLYYGFLEDFYPVVKNRFDLAEYYEAVRELYYNIRLFDQIIRAYIEDYIQMNEMIESMPEGVLAKFIVDVFEVNKNSHFGNIDFFPSNIIVSDGKISLIDNCINKEGEECIKTPEQKQNDFVASIAGITRFNEMVFDLNSTALFRLDDVPFDYDYSDLQQKNEKVCKAAAIRLIDLMNKYCDNPKCTSFENFMFVFTSLKKFLGSSVAEEILKRVNADFKGMNQ